MFKRIVSPLVALALVASASGQRQPPQTQNRQDGDQQDEVVKVTTNLVQFDVVVTDRQGRQIADLAPEDFEVSEDGKRVPITNFSYINAVAATTTPAVAAAAPEPAAAPSGQGRAAAVAPATLRREQVRRTVALVVDDLGISFESMGFVRDALRKFVDEQMQPTDAVAIFRTSAGIGAFQQFTSDKRALHAAIERVRWFPAGRGGTSPQGAFNEVSAGSDLRDTVQFVQEMEEARSQLYSAGTFNSATAIIGGMADMPGRKSVVLISEAFRIFSAQGRNTQLIHAMERLTTQANAASVTIYTMDASGLQSDTFTAEDQPAAPTYMISAEQFAAAGSDGAAPGALIRPNAPPRTLPRSDTLAAQAEADSGNAFRRLNAMMDQRREQRHEAHTVLSFLAAKTGGLFMRNRNDLGGAMQRIMDDQRGYYLIGYRPNLSGEERDARSARLRNISVKVKRSGAQVRTRSSYLGVLDVDRRAKPRTREEQLTAALISPFASGDVRVRLTTLFSTESAAGAPQPYVRALLHVDARDLSFREEPGGARQTDLEVVGVVVGDGGQIVEQDSAVQTVRAANQEEYERLQREGLVYILNFPVKRAGSYQLRVAARESSSERLGAASHYVEVPKLDGSRLALSGVVLSGVDSAAAAQPNPQSGPAVRQLRQGQLLDYRYYIHNAKTGPDGRPQLQTQMRIFRDNQPVFTGKQQPLDASKQANVKRLGAAGRVRIGPELTPGLYLLQVTVTDTLAPANHGTATQWIDFEVVG